MYTRAYPPKDTPIPEGYSGVALWQGAAEEEESPIPSEEEIHKEQPSEEREERCEPSPYTPAPSESKEEDALSQNADILLLLLAAVLLQGERPENELAILLLLLLLWES